MDFTISFLKLFVWFIFLVAPLLIFLCATIVVLGQIVARVEGWGKFNGLYWSFITATTVGYGDFRPSRKRTKLLSILIAFVGLLFTGILIAVALEAVKVSLEKHLDPSVVEQIKEDLK